MKTPREKAIEYCMEVEGQIHQPYIDAFIAGYQSANEWISVDDELPEIKNDGYWFIGKDKDDIHYALYIDSIVEHEEITATEITHWKHIN